MLDKDKQYLDEGFFYIMLHEKLNAFDILKKGNIIYNMYAMIMANSSHLI